MAAYLLALQWLLACAGSVAAGMTVWLLLNGAAHWWPALRTRRNVWLAAQCVAAAAALLPFLPHPSQITIAPPIDLGRAPAAAPTQALAQAGDDASDALSSEVPPAGVAAARATVDILPLASALWLPAYAAGLAWAIARQLRARRVCRALLATAQRLTSADLRLHPAFTAGQLAEIARRHLAVLRTDAPVSPMLVGVRRARLLLPAHLDALSTGQQQMIIAHELHHWRSRDPLCLAFAALMQTVFWFNPTLRWMARQMEWALELSCDQHVLAGRPQQQRKQYAASLLQQWSTTTAAGVAAFNGATITARIRHMQKDSLPALSAAAGWLTAAAMSAVLAIGALLQPALAFSVAPQQSPAATVLAPVAESWRAPLDKVRVTSFFGVQRSILPTPHKGIDFAAAKGTPVHATASGVIVSAGPLAENDGRYGNAVIIDHGAQRSLYAHLSSVSVQAGQRVQAGQLIGAVGQSGFATGPHLHLEVRQNGRNIDPATLLTDLDAYATPRALKVRRQQLPSKG